MRERHASDCLTKLYDTLRAFHVNGKAVPHEALPKLLKVVLMSRELAREVEEELEMASHELAIAELLLAAREAMMVPQDTSHAENVLRLPTRPRVVHVHTPDGGDAA